MPRETLYQDAVTGVLALADAVTDEQGEFSEEEQESLDLIADAVGDDALMDDIAAEIEDDEYNAALAAEEQADGFALGQPGEIHQAILQRNRQTKHDANR